MNDATLVLSGVTKKFGAMVAVDDVSLSIAEGTFFSLLGPSGSGKTTLLNVIAGFVPPDGGRVSLGGRDLTLVPPEKRNFGMVFQGYALFPHMTVAENVAFPLDVRGIGRAEKERRVNAVLDTVQLGGFATRTPKQLSGGQQQRVALARALVFEPDILLLDEPLSALDKKLRMGLQAELRELQRRVGKTFICVTHDQDEALNMSDAIAILRGGRIVQSGPPRELFDHPASHFAADFLGESNFVEGVCGAPRPDGLVPMRVGDETLIVSGSVPAGKALAAVRPFKIQISADEPMAQDNRLRGTLRSFDYLGSEFHCVVTTSIGTLTAICPTWQGRFRPEADAPVWLGWPADAAQLVEDDR